MGSVGHAASNFSQYDDYAFPANYPAFLRGNPPEDQVLLIAKFLNCKVNNINEIRVIMFFAAIYDLRLNKQDFLSFDANYLCSNF